MFHQDWLMRQIESMIAFVFRILFGKEIPGFELGGEEEDGATDLFYKLRELLDQDKINEAENLLFLEMDLENKRYLAVALDFYGKLNEREDEELEAHGFSREEVAGGVKEVLNNYGVDIPEILEIV